MKVSVITVCYNSEQTIERTVQSVILQTYEDIEYIVIDGNSSDRTVEILKRYECHIDYLISESDTGIYDAMNKGIQKASGDIICFLNSDDLYESDRVLERVVNEMKSDNLDALFGSVVFFKQKNISRVVRTYRLHQFDPSQFAFGWMPAHPATFIKKDTIRQNGLFDTKFQIAGDFDYLLRMFTKLKFHYKCTDDVLVRMQSGGLSNRNLFTKWIQNKEILYACKNNQVKSNWFKILVRYPAKLLECAWK